MARHRYRVTVTPVEKDGLHCAGRCAIEFEHAGDEDWMRLLEGAQRLPGLSADERAALVIGAALFADVADRHRSAGDPSDATVRARIDTLVDAIQNRPTTA